MTHDEASSQVISFGPYRDLTLVQVRALPGGEEYLRGLVRERAVPRRIKEAIGVFLDSSVVSSG